MAEVFGASDEELSNPPSPAPDRLKSANKPHPSLLARDPLPSTTVAPTKKRGRTEIDTTTDNLPVKSAETLPSKRRRVAVDVDKENQEDAKVTNVVEARKAPQSRIDKKRYKAQPRPPDVSLPVEVKTASRRLVVPIEPKSNKPQSVASAKSNGEPSKASLNTKSAPKPRPRPKNKESSGKQASPPPGPVDDSEILSEIMLPEASQPVGEPSRPSLNTGSSPKPRPLPKNKESTENQASPPHGLVDDSETLSNIMPPAVMPQVAAPQIDRIIHIHGGNKKGSITPTTNSPRSPIIVKPTKPIEDVKTPTNMHVDGQTRHNTKSGRADSVNQPGYCVIMRCLTNFSTDHLEKTF